MDLQQKLRESRIEITQLTAALSFAEESTLQLQNQIKAEIKTREDLQAANETEMDTIKERFRLKANDMQVELDIKDAEIESLEHQLQSKAGFIAKLEQSFASDTTRLEKKLAAQQKLCDILTQQNTNAALAAQSNAQKYHEEIRKLKSKLQDQEKAVLSITEYVDQQEKKLYDEKHSVFYGNNNLNHNSSFYGSGSFYGGGSISRIGSMAIDVDDNMSTTSSFYGTSPVRVESKLTPDLRSESLDAGVDEYGLKYVEDVDEDDDEDKTASSQNKVKSNTAINMNIPRIVTVGRGNSAQTPPSALKSPKSRGVLSVSIDLNQNVVNSGQKICDSPLLSPPRRGEFDFDSLHLDSSYYEQLLYGLQLATTHMEMNLLEEKSIRNYLIKTDHHHKEFENELHYQVQKLSESEDFLLHGQRQLQESVQFHQSNYTNLQERYSNLEDKFNEHVKELYRVNKLEKVGNIQMQNIEQTLAENKLMVDKLKHEVHALKQDNNDLKLNQMQLEGKLEEGNQEYLLLQSFCDLIQKEKELLQQEKQDMVLKYMSSQQQSRQSHNNMAYDHQDDYDDSSSYLRHEDLSAHVLSLTKPAEAITRSRSSSPKTTSKLINSASAPSNPEMTVQDLLHKYRHLAKPHLTSVAEERKSATTSPLRQKSYSEDFSHDNSAVFEPLRLSDQVVSNITSSPSPYNNTLRTYALNTGLPQYEPARSKRSYRK